MTSDSSTAKVQQRSTPDKHTRPFSVRMTVGELKIVRRAAFVKEESRSAFIAKAAVERAKAILAERGELRAEDQAA